MGDRLDFGEIVKRACKYLIEGGAVAIAAFYIPNKKLKCEEILMIAVTAAATFAILDMYASEIGGATRMGAGFGVGANLVGFPTSLYYMSKEVRIGVIGNVDSGKTTIIGVLVNDHLDDGRGKARSSVLKHHHEKISGRTSSITQCCLSNDKLNKDIIFVDLAGHEAYLKTTLHGLIGYYIDYVMIVVASNRGVTRMTIEHLQVTIALEIPFFIVITKTDISPEHIRKKTIDDIKFELLKNKIVPIISVSCKSGDQIEKLRNYIMKLKNRIKYEKNNKALFSIESKYSVEGVGLVISGKLFSGEFKKNDKALIGPINGVFTKVILKSFHNNHRQEVGSITAGDSACIAIRIMNKKKFDTKFLNSMKGLFVILDDDSVCENLHREFIANISILGSHATTIKEFYTPIINCKKIVQAATIVEIMNGGKYLRSGDTAKIRFKFCFRPELISVNDILIFREGNTRGVGIVTTVL